MNDALDDRVNAIERAICQETCAAMGEPPCWQFSGGWPNPDCNDPGCHALAVAAAIAASGPRVGRGYNPIERRNEKQRARETEPGVGFFTTLDIASAKLITRRKRTP